MYDSISLLFTVLQQCISQPSVDIKTSIKLSGEMEAIILMVLVGLDDSSHTGGPTAQDRSLATGPR